MDDPGRFTQVALENNGMTIGLQAPDPGAGWTTPAILRARSQADTGSRNGKVDSDPRDGVAQIIPNIGSITVTPNGICIPLGGEREFSAVVHGMNNQDVTWSASAGSFTGDTYHAPGSSVEEVTITATSVENPAIIGTAVVEVGDCDCYWSAVVTGAVTNAPEGIFATWTDEFYTVVTLVTAGGGSPAFAVTPESIVTSTGTYVAYGSAYPTAGDVVFASNADGSLVVTYLDDAVMEGVSKA